MNWASSDMLIERLAEIQTWRTGEGVPECVHKVREEGETAVDAE